MRISLLCVLALCLALFAFEGHAFAQEAGDDGLEALDGRILALLQAGKYPEALPLAEQYAAGVKARFGENATQYATALNMQAVLLGAANRFAEAEALLRRALEIDEKVFGPDHPNIFVK